MEADGSFGGDSNRDTDENVAAASGGGTERWIYLDDSTSIDQILAGEGGGMEASELKVLLLEAKAYMAESKFEQLGAVEEIDEAIKCRTEILSLAPDGHVERPRQFGTLGVALFHRFMSFGQLGDLSMAIEYQTQAVQLTPDGDADKPSWINNLGTSYEARFGHLGDLADLDKAIGYLTQAVLLTPDESAHVPSLLNNLGASYESRFRRLGELADLNQAIDYQTQAVLLTPDENVDKPSWMSNLGISYGSRFRHLGELADLNRAIDYQTQAVLLTPDGYADKPKWMSNLGISHEFRFLRLGEVEDLNKAIGYKTQALLLTPDGHAEKPGRLSSLGTSYKSRFSRFGELADLNQAIDYQTQALLLTPDGHADKPVSFENLGSSYHSRFIRLGELTDVNRAIEYHTRAVLLTPGGHVDKPGRMNNLAIAYLSRFELLGVLADLNQAIDFLNQGVLVTPDGHAAIPVLLHHLGVSYQLRFGRLAELVDLNKAIDYKARALLLTPDDHVDKPRRLHNLGVSYECRFRCLDEPEDLDKGIEYQVQAELLTPDGHADKPTQLRVLGNSYQSRFTRLGKLSDLEFAQSSFQRAAQLPFTHPETQLWCARKWAQCSISLGLTPQTAYERCMELIPYHIWLGTTIDQRYTFLTEIIDLATEAAAWAVSVKALDQALEWLEEGRSIVWNQILQLRTPLDDLSSVDPSLAQELKDTASRLQHAGSRRQLTEPLSIDESSDLEKEAQEHHSLASKWEELLEKARKLPGFENFLRPRKVTELRLAATDGPVVVVNTHSTRCDALILFPECDDRVHLPLSRLSMDKLDQACVHLDSLIGHRGGRARGLKLSKPTLKPEHLFKNVLVTLWSDVVQPVMEILASREILSTNELPHVTWCTTGALSFLPLHAAGRYDGSQPNTFDLVISSYAPTLNALISSRTSLPDQDFGLLAVGQENTQDLGSLPNTVHELAAIKMHAKVMRFQQLDAENGTVDAVLRAMGEHSWVHLACHATQNPSNPAHSAFHLHDGNLTLEAITKCAFKNKGLAFLSACQTAAGDRKLPDEAVHLAAGMLMAGYPSVIATMWSIYDEDGPQVAGEVYAELLKDGRMDRGRSARVLHTAVAGLREKVGHEAFQRWVPFIHMGI